MPSGRAALSWGFVLSLALHALWLGSAPDARPHVRRAPPAHTSQLELVPGTARPATPAAVEIQVAAEPAPREPAPREPAPREPAPGPVAKPVRARAPGPRPSVASSAPPLPAAEPTGRDLGALERTLKRIAATTELTQDERRRAMLVVLRTWEDPTRKQSAEQLIQTLLLEQRPGEDR